MNMSINWANVPPQARRNFIRGYVTAMRIRHLVTQRRGATAEYVASHLDMHVSTVRQAAEQWGIPLAQVAAQDRQRAYNTELPVDAFMERFHYA